jgi:hypothetical protein
MGLRIGLRIWLSKGLRIGLRIGCYRPVTLCKLRSRQHLEKKERSSFKIMGDDRR